ncbi:MAG TPA: hypothetical protein VJ938_12135 [Acidimicrobiia bacterium]|nr:hypothetical protein [Acidimicrobiia bacterium]
MDQIDFARIPLHARRNAALRYDATPHLLEILADDPDADVRLAVAANPATPLESLQRLAGDAVTRVAARAGITAVVARLTAG